MDYYLICSLILRVCLALLHWLAFCVVSWIGCSWMFCYLFMKYIYWDKCFFVVAVCWILNWNTHVHLFFGFFKTRCLVWGFVSLNLPKNSLQDCLSLPQATRLFSPYVIINSHDWVLLHLLLCGGHYRSSPEFFKAAL